jgi:GNAT superfamily N-acetyltransferase
MVKIRQATRSDNEGLLKLTSMTPMDGEISIRIDRHPDFFTLLDRRGRSHVVVAEANGVIVGCISAARVLVHVNGKPKSVHYLGDLKVHPDYRGTGLAFRLLKSMHLLLLKTDSDLVFLTAAYGNERVMPFFNGRAGLPKAVPLGIFKVYQVLPSPRRRKTSRYAVNPEHDLPALTRFYNHYFRQYQFGPIFQSDSLRNAAHWAARYEGEIKASISMVDVGDFKQNVLVRLPFLLERLVAFIRYMHGIVPVANLPERNKPIRILYVKAFACVKGHEEALAQLIQIARNVSYEREYHFLAVGIHERDPLTRIFAKYPKFTFKSLGFAVRLNNKSNDVFLLKQGVPYEDYSLV